MIQTTGKPHFIARRSKRVRLRCRRHQTRANPPQYATVAWKVISESVKTLRSTRLAQTVAASCCSTVTTTALLSPGTLGIDSAIFQYDRTSSVCRCCHDFTAKIWRRPTSSNTSTMASGTIGASPANVRKPKESEYTSPAPGSISR